MGRSNPEEIAGQEGKIFEGDLVMKPLRCGISEVTSYKKFRSKFADLLPYIPQFHGTQLRKDEKGTPTEYLVMQNLAAACVKPAVMDIKIGQSQNVQEPLKKGSVALDLGCYVAGVDSSGVQYRNRVDGYRGREVSVQEFQQILSSFFSPLSKAAMQRILERLNALYHVMFNMKGVKFYSASLLFIYDDLETDFASVYLIDFERVEFTKDSEPDFETLRALKNVIEELSLHEELST